jgi:hypothetical protein
MEGQSIAPTCRTWVMAASTCQWAGVGDLNTATHRFNSSAIVFRIVAEPGPVPLRVHNNAKVGAGAA